MNQTKPNELFNHASSLSLEIAEANLKALFLLLQTGFYINACVGCTIQDFFQEQLGLSDDYIRIRVQGIFLDGKPVDHIDRAVIRNGARLTLSGTMPGLAGMSLRSGPLAVFRHSITHRETGDYQYSGDGFVQLKLLNLLMRDMGPQLMKKGIYLEYEVLAGFLANLPEKFWQECKSAALDGSPVNTGLLQRGEWSPAKEMVKLTVVAG